MKILFVSPNVREVIEYSKKKKYKPQMLFGFVNLGIKVLMALTPKHHEVKVVDELFNQKIDFDEKVDVVAISALTAQAFRAYAIADEFRKRGVTVVMGGIHASAMPDEALTHCDAICEGEGEYIWQQMLLDIESGTLKKVYKSDKEAELKDVPSVKDFSYFKGEITNALRITRGCKGNCSFCSIKRYFGKRYRTLEVERVLEEIQFLKDNKRLSFNILFFCDDNLIADRAYAKSLFTAMIPLKVKWVGQATIEIATDDELLELAKKSGCVGLLIGFESIYKENLEAVNKKCMVDVNIEEAIKKIHKKNIFIFGMFIIGFDGDTREKIEGLYKFIYKNNLAYGTFNILTPFPGTKVRDDLEAEGRAVSSDWDKYSLNYSLFEPKSISSKELEELQLKYFRKLGSLRSIFKRVLFSRAKVGIALYLNFSARYLVNDVLTTVKKEISSRGEEV